MKNANRAGLATVAIILLLLVILAVHIAPNLAGVMGSILLGIAAIILAITGHRPRPAAGDDPADDASAAGDTSSTSPEDDTTHSDDTTTPRC
jgi:hypothetical protein